MEKKEAPWQRYVQQERKSWLHLVISGYAMLGLGFLPFLFRDHVPRSVLGAYAICFVVALLAYMT